jgi:hypothetical protein
VGSKFCHFPSKALRSSEVHVHSNVHDDPTRCLKEQVHLTKAMDLALVEAIQEIEDLHKRYKEQVIKNCDDLIIELLAEAEGSDDNSDNDSDDEGNTNGNDEGNGDGNDGGDDNIEEVLE